MNKKIKTAIVAFLNAYRLKEYYMLLKYHRLFEKPSKKPMLIAAIDGRRSSQGLTDRFNGIISIYALSKATNSTFRLIYTHPFQLTDFLIPNKYHWIPNDDELSNSVKDVRYKIMRKQHTLVKLLPLFPLDKQIRVYANYNYLDKINPLYGIDFQFNELFDELFKPTEILDEQIQFHKERIGGKYIACVFRFQSLLGDFKEYRNKAIGEKEQKELIEKNKNALLNIIETNDCPVLVTSDSMTFISEINTLKNVYTLPGKVVHLDCSFGEDKEVYMKSLIDFFMIANAEKVYGIGTKIMYPSSFPMFAAKVNNAPFERIIID